MKKRMVSLLLTLCMALTLLPATASANFELGTQTYVAGVNVFGGGFWVNDNSGGITNVGATAENYNVAYDSNKHVLTLRDAYITKATSARGERYAAIWSDGNLKVRLEGTNEVDLSENGWYNGDCAAVSVGYYGPSGDANLYSALELSGSGSIRLQSGNSSNGNSSGIFSVWKVIVAGNVKVEAYGGACGANFGSYGIFLGGTSDDFDSVVDFESAQNVDVIAGTGYGGKYSYGVRGKVGFPKFNNFQGSFMAWCGDASDASALDREPLYMPKGVSLLASYTGQEINCVPYDSSRNKSYHFLKTVSGLPEGARVTKPTENAELRTGYSITLNPSQIIGGEEGDVVEYAVGMTNSDDAPTKGWQTSTTFIGLTPNYSYSIWARVAATATHTAGPIACGEGYARTKTGYSWGGGVDVNGERMLDHERLAIGDGYAVYDKDTKTLTLSGTMNITNGTVEHGNGVVSGILSSVDHLYIVLADGADVTISLANTEKDPSLVKTLGNSISSGPCSGIYCHGSLTISSAGKSRLTINVSGSKSVYGIHAGDKLGANLLQIDMPESDISVNATVNDGAFTAAVYSMDTVDITCGTMTAVVSGASGVGDSAAILAQDNDTGITLHGGTVEAVNNSGGQSRAIKHVVSWPQGTSYTASDENDILLATSEKTWMGVTYSQLDMPMAKRVKFIPGELEELTGTVTLTGNFRVGSTITAVVEGTNARPEELTYTWYMYWSETSYSQLRYPDNNPTYTIKDSGVGAWLVCKVESAGRSGELWSPASPKIEKSEFPNLYVDGVQLTTANFADILGNDTASYDLDTNTLTLKNAELTKALAKNGKAVIESNLELTVLLKGSNSVTVAEGAYAAVYSEEKLTFTGSGTLTAAVQNATKGKGGAINTSGDIVIEGGCTIKVTAANSAVKSADGSVTIRGGALTAETSSASSLAASGDIVIADGSKVDLHSASTGRAVESTGGNLTVSDGATLAVTSNASKSTLAVCVENGTTTIRDGAKMTVKVERTASGTNGTGGGLRTNSLLISNGSLAVENIADKDSNAFPGGGYWASPAVYSSSALTIINGGELKACSETGWGIATRGVLDVQYGGRMVVSGGNQAIKTGGSGAAKISAPVSAAYVSTSVTGENATIIVNPESKTICSLSYKYVRIAFEFEPVLTLTRASKKNGIQAKLQTDGHSTDNAEMLFALYDTEGKLLEIIKKTVSLAELTQTPDTVFFEGMERKQICKVFLLDANGAPLCAAVSKEIVY